MSAVIDLVSDGDEEVSAGNTCNEDGGSPSKRLKLSGDTDDDEIEVVEEPQLSMDSTPPSSSEETAETSNNESDEIAVVGTKNQTLLPHMRPHCGAHPFRIPTKETRHDDGEATGNMEFCEQCFCFICDIPVHDCPKWTIHCNATDQGPCAPMCMQLRHRYRSEKKKRAAQPRCRHCAFPFSKPPRSLRFCGDWCTQCGRVALESALRHTTKADYTPTPNDVSLGEREIHFLAVPRDLRTMTMYKDAWEENKGKPGWAVDTEAEAVEFVEHRLGPRPTLQVLLMSIAVAGRESVPSDGVIRSSSTSVSADEAEAIVLENEHDLLLLRVMQEVEFGRSSIFKGSITQAFDGESQRGVGQ